MPPGPRPTPTGILRLRGSNEVSHRKDEPVPTKPLPECPDWINAEAKLVWAQVVPQLDAMGILGGIDANALSRYCQLWSRWKDAEQFIQKYGSTYSLNDEAGKPKCFQQFPEVAIAHRLAAQLTKMEAEFGMTPSSRTRIQVEAKSKDKNDKGYFAAG